MNYLYDEDFKLSFFEDTSDLKEYHTLSKDFKAISNNILIGAISIVISRLFYQNSYYMGLITEDITRLLVLNCNNHVSTKQFLNDILNDTQIVQEKDIPLLVKNPIYVLSSNVPNKLLDCPLIFSSNSSLDNKVNLTIRYNKSLYSQKTIEKILSYWIVAIDELLIKDTIGEISCLPQDEYNLVTNLYNDTFVEILDIKKNLIDIFEDYVDKYPNVPLLISETKSYTYLEVDSYANYLAKKLVENKKVNLGDRIAVIGHRSVEFLISFIAILKAGCTYVPIDIEYPDDRIQYILNESKPTAIISLVENILNIDDNYQKLILYYEYQKCTERLNITISNNSIAYIIFTSGTTGNPKGVLVTHKNVINLREYFKREYNLRKNHTVLQFANIVFDASIWEVTASIFNGGTLYIPNDSTIHDAYSMEEYLKSNKIDLLVLPPQYYLSINTDNISTINTAGSSSSYDVAKKSIKECGKYYNLYGPTETTVMALNWNTTTLDNLSKRVPIGKPICNTQIYIMNGNHICGTDMIGEICISGYCVSNGYLNRTELQLKKFTKTPDGSSIMYHSGDLGRWNIDGNIEFLGRIDRQVKIRGYRIELEEIETVIRNLPYVNSAIVQDIKNNDISDLYAYVILNDNSYTGDDVINSIRKTLPSYMIPVKVIIINEIPTNISGKVDYNVLKDLTFKDAISNDNINDLQFSNEIQKQIYNIIYDVLNVYPQSLEQSFLEYGGNSLTAMQLQFKISETFKVKIPLLNIVDDGSISSIANLISIPQNAKSNEVFALITNPKEQYEPFNLNDLQISYYIGRNNMSLGNAPTRAYLRVLAGTIDIQRLEVAMNKLIQRHDVLRCVICDDLKQRILKEVPYYHIEVLEYENDDKNTFDSFIYDSMIKENIDLTKFPNFKLIAAKNSSNEYTIHSVIDVTMIDGSSVSILQNDLIKLYREEELPPIDITLRDYMISFENIHNTKKYTEDMQYWSNRINSLPSAPNIPLKQKENTSEMAELYHKDINIDNEYYNNLKFFANQYKVSIAEILIGIYACILARWSNSRHFVINIPMFNKIPFNSSVKNLCGEFDTLVFLEINIKDDFNFIDLCQSINKQILSDMEHNSVTGPDIIRKANIDYNKSLVFPVIFTNISSNSEYSLSNKYAPLEYFNTQSSNVWIDCISTEIENGLSLSWDCRKDLIYESIIDDMFNSFVKLIYSLSKNNTIWKKSISNIVDIPNMSLIKKYNPPTVKTNENNLLHKYFYDSVKNNPDNIACISKGIKYTYNELYRMSLYVSKQLGYLEDDTLIGVYMNRNVMQLPAILGILCSGGAYVPINSDWSEERIKKVIDNASIKKIVTIEKFKTYAEDTFNVEVITTKDDISNDITLPNINLSVKDNSLAYVIYTSGTTGVPKGVAIEHSAVCNTINDVNHRFDVDSSSVVLSLSELCFDLSVYDIFGMFAVGGTIYYADETEKKDVALWKDIIINYNVSVWNTVPAMMEMLVDYYEDEDTKFNSLKTIMLSGDWIPLTLPNKILNKVNNAQLYSLGGATEASIWSNYYKIENINPAWKSIPYGYPLYNQKMYIINENDELCPTGVSGRILIGGAGLARCYINDVSLTDKRFKYNKFLNERLYDTGDIGKYLEDGSIEFLGRNDNQVKINGFRIELGEIESCILSHKMVDRCVVLPYGDINTGRQLTAFICYKKCCSSLTEDDIQKWCNQHIPSYMVPKRIILVDKFPLSANGKIDCKAILKSTQNKSSTNMNKVSNIDSIDQFIIDKISEFTGNHEISMDSNFFKVGGNSLQVIQLITSIKKQYKVSITIADFFACKNLLELKKLIISKT